MFFATNNFQLTNYYNHNTANLAISNNNKVYSQLSKLINNNTSTCYECGVSSVSICNLCNNDFCSTCLDSHAC